MSANFYILVRQPRFDVFPFKQFADSKFKCKRTRVLEIQVMNIKLKTLVN